jgi:hypothetical protein
LLSALPRLDLFQYASIAGSCAIGGVGKLLERSFVDRMLELLDQQRIGR